jgi:glutathione reductase (NADPH)
LAREKRSAYETGKRGIEIETLRIKQPMATYDYDLVTIGAGSGGVRASRIAASQHNAKVAIIELPFALVSSEEKGGAGGTCVIRGCVPKKLLVYASEFMEAFQDAGGFGWTPPTSVHSMGSLLERKAREIERLNSVYVDLLKSSGVEYIEGRGAVLDPHTVEVRLVDGSVMHLRTRNILIATGGHAVKIDIPGAAHAITSDEALMLENVVKEDIVVIGGGYIGVEFAGIFNGLGARVHLMLRGEYPLRAFDHECRAVVLDNLKKRGVQVHTGCTPSRIEQLANGRKLLYCNTPSGEIKQMEVSQVMFATGRRPNSKNIGLEKAGVVLDERTGAVVVDAYSETTVSGIWAIGDVTNRLNLTPVALMEGKALAQTIFGGIPTKPDHENVPSAVFCQPPLGSIGMSEEQAVQKLSGDIDIYVSRFRPMKNTLSGRDEKTLMKMLVHVPTDRVVGCHMVGADAGEIIQGLGIALKCKATKSQFDSCVGVHPTAAEEWVTMSSATRRVTGMGKAVPQ